MAKEKKIIVGIISILTIVIVILSYFLINKNAIIEKQAEKIELQAMETNGSNSYTTTQEHLEELSQNISKYVIKSGVSSSGANLEKHSGPCWFYGYDETAGALRVQNYWTNYAETSVAIIKFNRENYTNIVIDTNNVSRISIADSNKNILKSGANYFDLSEYDQNLYIVINSYNTENVLLYNAILFNL